MEMAYKYLVLADPANSPDWPGQPNAKFSDLVRLSHVHFSTCGSQTLSDAGITLSPSCGLVAKH